jgi:tetratricopeptide (TPR) repeat protein
MGIARDNIFASPKPYDVDKALKDISKAIELDSSLIEAYELRAMLYYYILENSEKALNDINTILELQPDNQFALDLKKDIMSDAQ